jgi:hypothetical protein
MATVIKFSSDHSWAVTEDLEKVEASFRLAMKRNPSLAHLTLVRGATPVVINVNLVRGFYERSR